MGEDEPKGGPPRKPPTIGYDGGKQGKRRQRHRLVETQGVVLKVLVHAATRAARAARAAGGPLLREAFEPDRARFPLLCHLWVDAGDRGVDAGDRGRFVDWVKTTLGWSVEGVKQWWTGVAAVWVFPGQDPPEKPTGFQLLKWRWIVERTVGWIGFSRRRSKDDEDLPETSEAMVYTVMSRLMLARLAAMAP